MRERKDAQVAVMEDLWVAASSTTEIEEAPESNGGDFSHSKLAPSRWYEEVTSNLESAVLYNEETVAAVKKAREKFGAIGAKLLKDVHEKKIQAEEEGMRTPPPEPTMLVSGDPIQMIQLQLIWLI